jgi:hypothetical protein
VTSTGDSTTTFTTTTNVFRVNYDPIDAGPPGTTAVIRILNGETGMVVAAQSIPADQNSSVFFDLPPGTYRVEVDIEPESAESETTYILSVDACGGTTLPPADQSAF